MEAEKLSVNFYQEIDDRLLKYAVIVSKYDGKWVFCKHRARDTYEVPGGHREPDEDILAAAKRELYEETGAVEYDLTPVCIYSVKADGSESYGMLYFAQIKALGPLPQSEIEKVFLLENLPDRWTYPLIQPKLIDKVLMAVNLSPD